MSEKRRDSRNRILKDGERQREDGRYEYRYIDKQGKSHSVYSWRLTDTDKTPTGKRHKASLREIERNILIAQSTEKETDYTQTKSLNYIFDKYIEERRDIKETTRQGCKGRYNKHIRNKLGNKPISTISYNDIKELYTNIITTDNMKYGTLTGLNSLLSSLFNREMRCGTIKTNPCNGVMKDIKHLFTHESKKKHALTIPQQKAFLKCCDKYWYNVFAFLLGTGCRINEMVALRWEDCDFENDEIHINHSMAYYKINGKAYGYKVTTPKTQKSIRDIPMLEKVKKILLEIKECRKYNDYDKIEIDGYNGFIFIGKKGGVLNARNVHSTLKRICESYNSQERESAEKENREPLYLPYFSAHNLRHTFTTRMCENEPNIKIVQEILGHSNISTTMDVYTEVTNDKKKASFQKNLEGKMAI